MKIPHNAPALVVSRHYGKIQRERRTFGDLVDIGKKLMPAQSRKRILIWGMRDGEETSRTLYTDEFFSTPNNDVVWYFVEAYDIKSRTSKYVTPTAKNGRFYKEVYSGEVLD